MANKNNFLIKAKRDKNNEFYTQYSDIESEIDKFKDFFKGKIVYCPCDTSHSNFPKFFKDKFFDLGLTGLYWSSLTEPTFFYDGAKQTEIGESIDILSNDFIDMMKKADIVVTNPPFTHFVRFVDDIVEAGKDLLVIGMQNSATCKLVFEHIMKDNLKLHYGFKGIAGHFIVPDYYEDKATSGDHKEGMIRVSGVVWWTTLSLPDIPKFIFTSHYYDENGNPDNEKYQKYDNFRKISRLDEDLININKTKDIPDDYKGYMAVPVSFFVKYNPEQFELVQLDHYGPLGNLDNVVNGKTIYRRIIIKKKF